MDYIMTRPIKFRAWEYENIWEKGAGYTGKFKWQMNYEPIIWGGETMSEGDQVNLNQALANGGDAEVMPHKPSIFMQFTGLTDKNGTGVREVYECDIISADGKIIGNQYETPALLKDPANLLVQGFGTKTWLTTYAEAVERGCRDA